MLSDSIRLDDNAIRLVPDQHVDLDLYSATSLEQSSAGRHVAPFGHIIHSLANQFLPFLLLVSDLRRSSKSPVNNHKGSSAVFAKIEFFLHKKTYTKWFYVLKMFEVIIFLHYCATNKNP